MDEKQLETFTVRVPVKISQADDGTIIVHEYKYISFFSDRGNDVQMLPNEYAAFCDLMLDKTIRWTAANADGAKRIRRDADLYLWWQAFIEGPLSQVPIGDEQFRKSRAGLIHHTLLNSIRKAANLSPADFKALSLAEVFAVISDIHCREHNEENRLRHQETGRKPDGDRTQKKNSEKNSRPWDANCKRMAKAYIRQCVKDGNEISRLPFITEELRKNRTNYPNAKSAATINKAFQLNPDEWKPALSEALSKPDADRTH
jgi:hypothetical protein